MSDPVNSQVESTRPALSRVFLSTDDRPRPIFRALAYVVAGFILLTLAQAPIALLGQRLPLLAELALLYLIGNPVLLLLAWLFLRAFDRRSFRALGLWFYPGWDRELALGAALGATLLAIVAGAFLLARSVAYEGLAALGGSGFLRLTATGAVLFLAAAHEEIAFRGYGFQRLVEAIGPLGAVLAFSALFAAAHLRNPHATPLSTGNTVLAGVLLALAYLKTRALWLPIGLHWAWNFTMGPILSLPVSGIPFHPAVLRVELDGPQWLTGGAYGPEGGVASTAVCLAAILWLARTRRVSPSPAMEEALK